MGSISKNRLEKDINLCFYLCQTIIDRNDLQNESDKVIKSDVDSSTDAVIHRKVFRNMNPQGFQLEVLSSPRSSSSRMQSMSSLKASEVVDHVAFFEDDNETCCKITEFLRDKIHNNKDLYLKCFLSIEMHGSESIKEHEKHTLENRKTPVCKWFDTKTYTTEIRLDEIEGKRCESCDELNNKLMRTESELNDVQGRFTREGNRKCQKCDEYERKLSQAKQEYQELLDRFHVDETNAQNTGRDVYDIREQLKPERSNLKSLQRKVEVLERERNVIETDLHDKESELSKVRGELALLDRRNTNLQDENADLQRRCKSREEALVKMDLDMRQLKTENGDLKYDMVTLKQDKETLVRKLETERFNKLELEERRRNDISTAACDVSILCDPERSSRLGETFQNVFQGSWSKAFNDLKKKYNDLEVITYLADILLKSYKFGESTLSQYKGALDKALVDIAHGKQISSDIQKMNSDHATKMAKLVADDISELFLSTLGTDYRMNSNAVQTYVHEATAICWRFINHDPQLKLFFDPTLDHFDAHYFEEYSKSGISIAFLVWPMVYFEVNGEKIVISKGIAEGK